MNAKAKYSLVFSCCGGSDTGEIGDRAARMLKDEGSCYMGCTSGIAAGSTFLLNKTREADKVLAINGCGKRCASVILSDAGVPFVEHLDLEEMGLRKGFSPVTEDEVAKVVDRARELLDRPVPVR